jgi:hypothetical protein
MSKKRCPTSKDKRADSSAGRKTDSQRETPCSSKGKAEMFKLYRSATHLNSWIAYSNSTGWLTFPARENGWNDRRPVRGLDPMHLREVPVKLASNTGLLEHSDDLVAA